MLPRNRILTLACLSLIAIITGCSSDTRVKDKQEIVTKVKEKLEIETKVKERLEIETKGVNNIQRVY